MKPELTHARLLELVHYDQVTGLFTWKAKREHCSPGKPVGYTSPKGYLSVCLDGRKYYGHRLAWLYVHGVWPLGVIDHRSRIKSENRIRNLRDVSQQDNMHNRLIPMRGSATGVLGASPYKHGGFRATIKINKKFVHIGIFPTAEEAHQAYMRHKELHQTGYVQ